MALSVLHKTSLDNDNDCGVWDSELGKWTYNGTYEACFEWKHAVEYMEQVDEATGYFIE